VQDPHGEHVPLGGDDLIADDDLGSEMGIPGRG